MEHVRTINREFKTGEKAVLHLESRSGTVIVEGRETDRVVIDAVVRVWTDLSVEADDAAALVEQAMEQDAHRVIVRMPALPKREGWAVLFGQGSRVDYHVRVPLHSAVRVLSKSGSVQITHVEGVVHTEAMSGKVGVDDITGDVTAISKSGSLLIERVRGEVTADARSGKVAVNHVQGGVTIDARSGSVEVNDVEGDLKVGSRSGSVNIDNVRGRMSVKSRAGSTRYRGKIVADAEFEALAGSIQLSVDTEFPFFVDAESGGGSVRSDLPPRRNGAGPEGGGPKVRLRTRAGSIRLSKLD
ncbi:MAG: DUF4097 family beta strand repeat-containing protein [Dehalococcoidia bacterium]